MHTNTPHTFPIFLSFSLSPLHRSIVPFSLSPLLSDSALETPRHLHSSAHKDTHTYIHREREICHFQNNPMIAQFQKRIKEYTWKHTQVITHSHLRVNTALFISML